MAERATDGLDYQVYSQRDPAEKVQLRTFEGAAAHAVRESLVDQTAYVVDVVARTRRAAFVALGPEGEQRWDNAGAGRGTQLVIERFEVRADSLGAQGRLP